MILKEKPWVWRIPFLAFLIAGSIWIIGRHQEGKGTLNTIKKGGAASAPVAMAACTESNEWYHNEGSVFGTTYHTTYYANKDLKKELEAALQEVDNSLSMFNPKSTISKVNAGTDMTSDSLLNVVFELSQKVSKATDGAFDVTVAPLVNAWGFGYKNGTLPNEEQIDSLRSLVGWNRVSITNGQVIKDDPRMVMDFSAIAKGFGCDVVAQMFRDHGIKDFMIEIGGEVIVEGKNDKGKSWRVGVNKPVDDPTSSNGELEEVLELSNEAMATSGNYRNYYTTEDGRRIAHTIDPHTGHPIQHSILSATVLAPSCAEADAFATSFMVMGLEKMKKVLEKQKQLKVFIIYADGDENKVFRTI